MVVGFADEVYHSLDDESEENQLEQQEEEEDCKHNSTGSTQGVPQHNQALKSQLNHNIAEVEDNKNSNRNPHLPLYQILALQKGLNSVPIFQHRHDAGQIPDNI